MPPDVAKVYHRLNQTAAYKFDGRDYHFKPHETRALPYEVAQHLHDTSIFKFEPVNETLYRAIVMEGQPGFEEPYDDKAPMELIDRSVDPEPWVKRGVETQPRKTEYKVVQGSEADMRKKDGKGVF